MTDREPDPLEPPKRSDGDAVHALVRAVASVVPGVGGAAAELFTFVVAPPLQKRTTEWMEAVAAELRRQGLALEVLAGDDQLSALVWQGLHVVARTHHQEKLDALRNAVVNVAAGAAPDDGELPSLFVRYVDELTPSHLAILSFLADHEEKAQVDSYEDLFQLTAAARGAVDRERFKLICEDLAARLLIRVSRELEDFPGMHEKTRLLAQEETEGSMLGVTSLGRKLLRFVSDPSGGDQPRE